MSNPSESPDIATSNVTVLTDSGYELITSAEYQESGMMPVYQAIETDFTKDIDPEWFNATGIATGAGTDFIEFNDHAILSAAPEALFLMNITIVTNPSLTQVQSFGLSGSGIGKAIVENIIWKRLN